MGGNGGDAGKSSERRWDWRKIIQRAIFNVCRQRTWAKDFYGFLRVFLCFSGILCSHSTVPLSLADRRELAMLSIQRGGGHTSLILDITHFVRDCDCLNFPLTPQIPTDFNLLWSRVREGSVKAFASPVMKSREMHKQQTDATLQPEYQIMMNFNLFSWKMLNIMWIHFPILKHMCARVSGTHCQTARVGAVQFCAAPFGVQSKG